MDMQLPTLPDLRCETVADAKAVDGLIAMAFGPGRYAKAAERLREHNLPITKLSFVARYDGQIVGCVRQWPVHIGGRPAVLLGPFAVDPAWRSRGLGAALIEQAVTAATEAGHDVILLVGDEPYFGRLGFKVAPEIRMPGPVDQRRVLVLPLTAKEPPKGTATL